MRAMPMLERLRNQPAPPPSTTYWADLAERAGAPVEGDIWHGLARRMQHFRSNPANHGLWAGLGYRSDRANERPSAVSGVVAEELTEDSQTFTVIRSPRGEYLRLTAAERELWQAMDGTKSVAALATEGFLKFRRLLPVADLAATLRSNGFLHEPPEHIYRDLQTRLTEQSTLGRGQHLLQTLRERQFAIEGVDRAIEALYRFGGRWLFTRFAAIFAALLVPIGVLALILGLGRAASDPAFQLLGSGTNFTSSLFGLWVALLIGVVLHELAHALTCKHFGRMVNRAGVMLYYGMPAAFVDTSDIWLAGRRARIAVSLAGPIADVLIGATAATVALIAAQGGPNDPIASIAFKLAFTSYLSAIFNCNPLLELDGYFMLSDWLRLPRLRQRALSFVGGPFWAKLRSGAALNREERIFALYGGLSAIYTIVAIGLTIGFWREQILGLLGQLWASGLAGRAVALLVIFGLIVPVGLGILAALIGVLRAAAEWLARRNLAHQPLLVVVSSLALTLCVALLPLRFGPNAWFALVGPLFWAVALTIQFGLRRDYRGAHLVPALQNFVVVSGLALITLIGRLIWPDFGLVWAGFELASFILLLFAGMVTFVDIDLRRVPARELAPSALLLLLAFAIGGLALETVGQQGNLLTDLLEAAPVYCCAIGLALLLPYLAELRGSRLFAAWLLLWLGIAAQAAAYIAAQVPVWRDTALAQSAAIGASGLWAAAWWFHYVALRRSSSLALNWPHNEQANESERLANALRYAYAGCYRLLHAAYGERRARALDDRMDVIAATANLDVTLDRDQVRIGAGLLNEPLDTQGLRFAEVLSYTVATIEDLCGERFAHSAVRHAYDALPWPEREAADRRCFPNTPWARALSRSFGDERAARLRLLRLAEPLSACDDQALAQLLGAAMPLELATGAPLPNPPGLYIVESGELVRTSDQGEFHRGTAIEQPSAPLDHYRTSVRSRLLFIPEALFRQTLYDNDQASELLLADMRRLERIALFAELPRTTLRRLASVARRGHYRERQVIVRQGLRGGAFHLITSGRAAVIISAEGERPRMVATLLAGEYFGEIELLRGRPPVASVVSLEPLETLTIDHEHLATLLAAGGGMARDLEQISSGRLRMIANVG